MEAAAEARVVVEAASALTRSELAAGALRTLARALDAQVALLYEEPRALDMHGYMVEGPPDAFGCYLRYAESDPLRLLKTRLNPRLAVTTNLIDKSKLRRTAVYGEIYGPLKVDQQMVLRLSQANYGESGLGAVVFCRGPQQRPWSPEEGAPLERLFPALSSALVRTRRFAAVAERAEVLEELIAAGQAECAFAAWALDGRALWLSPAAELPELSDLAHSDAPLARKWRALVRNEATDTRVELATSAGPIRGDLWLCSTPRRGAPFVALLTASRSLEEKVRRAAERFGLSAAEQRVLLALADGGSNGELSRDLYISVDTVRTHVQRILRKMRCDSRLKAVTRLGEL